MSIGAEQGVAASTQKDTKTALVAMCQGKQEWHVWNLAWGEETVVWMRPQSQAHDGVL